MTPREPLAAVDVSGLVKRYGKTTALDGVHFTAPAGQVLALLGPNGAGKTTTVEICEGFRQPDAGTVRVLGLDPSTQNAALRPRIGVMPQGGGAYPGIRADEMLHLIARCAAHPLDSDWLLSTLGLDSARRTPYKRLSGGQQQRLSLACALVGRPELVFLDEPTAGLDPQARRLVWDLIAALRTDGVAVVLTTHLMDEAETLADRVVIIDHGRVVAAGRPHELTRNKAGDSEIRFHARPGLNVAALADELPNGCQPTEIGDGEYRVVGAITPHVVSSVTTWCAKQGVLADSLHVIKRNLEDVFLDLTGRELRS